MHERSGSGPERLRVVIADDEAAARGRLVRVLGDMAGVEIVGICETGREAVSAIEREAPDLALLDVQMPGLDAFGVIEAIGPERMPAVVLITAYDHFAVRAFQQQAIDFVVKPFDNERVEQAVQRAAEWLERDRLAALAEQFRVLLRLHRDAAGMWPDGTDAGTGPSVAPGAQLRRIPVRVGDNTILVPVDEIDWIEAAGKYSRIHAGAATHELRTPMHSLEVRLPHADFVRIHKSTIVRLDRIRELRPRIRGDYLVILHDGTKLRMSRGRRAQLEARIGHAL